MFCSFGCAVPVKRFCLDIFRLPTFECPIGKALLHIYISITNNINMFNLMYINMYKKVNTVTITNTFVT